MAARVRRFLADHVLAEWLRSLLGTIVFVIVAVIAFLLDHPGLGMVVAFVGYLVTYCAFAYWVFATTPPDRIQEWTRRRSRWSRAAYRLLGTEPGPIPTALVGLSAVSLAFVLARDPMLVGEIPAPTRIMGILAVISAAWWSVVTTYAVDYYTRWLATDRQGLRFPGEPDDEIGWSDFIYFSVAVSATFSTTDVSVVNQATRRAVTVHAVLALAFNVLVIAIAVGLLVSS